MSDRATARVVGGLFIVASVAAIVGGLLLLPVTDPEPAASLAGQEVQVVSGALIELVLVLSVVAIAAYLFPVLRRTDEGLALGYLGARSLEAVILLAATMTALVAFALFESGIVAPADPVGELLLTVREQAYFVGSQLVFGVTAIILNVLLFRARLVPAWLSLWGLVGGVLIVVRGLLFVYGIEASDLVQGLLVAPIGLNEMVLAVWLIVRGFGAPVAVAEPMAGPQPTRTDARQPAGAGR